MRREPVAKATVWSVAPLDPWLTCGPDTSVRELWRAQEADGTGARRYHLVFFDRYGWYCEHGRTCPAVAEVRAVLRDLAAAQARRERDQRERKTGKGRARTGR